MTTSQTSAAPRWLHLWLLLLPPAYVLSPVALFALRALVSLPIAARWLLGIYALSQLLPALFTPAPLLATLGGLGRTALIFGLLAVGHQLQEAPRVRPVLWGLGVVCLTALGFSQFQGVDWLSGRLLHPYLTTTSLGLVGAYMIWLGLFLPGHWAWRVPAGLLGLTVLLASGSRGPLVAAFFGVLLGLLMGRRRRWWLGGTLGVACVLMVALLGVGEKAQIATLERFQQFDLAGRQIIWNNALSLIQDAPLGGVGSYQVGASLAPTGDCYFLGLNGTSDACPAWVRASGQPWLIAHNGVLHQWAETGPLGTLGLFMMIGALLYVALRRRDQLVVAALGGIILTNLIDNTWIVPGLVSGELFWVLAGTQLRHVQLRDSSGAAVTGTTALLVLALPLLAITLPRRHLSPVQLQFIAAAPTFIPGQPYRVVAQLQGQPGTYRLSLNSCTLGCRSVRITDIVLTDQGSSISIPDLTLAPDAQQELEWRLYSSGALSMKPLAVYRWSVRAAPAAASSVP